MRRRTVEFSRVKHRPKRHIASQKQSSCVLWDMTFDTSACARRNFSRLFLSPVGLGQSTMWYDWWTEEDMAFERRSGWAESAGNKPVVRWQNGLWNGLAFFLSIGTERNEFRTNGPKWKIVHLTGPNWTDGNLGCKGRAKNSEIPNSSSQQVHPRVLRELPFCGILLY